MARQRGTVPFTGKVGTLTGFKLNGEYYVKASEDDGGQGSNKAVGKKRDNNSQFGRASTVGKLIRYTAGNFGRKSFVKNSSAAWRMNSMLMDLLMLDTVSVRNELKVLAEHLHLIKGFEFNEEALVAKITKLKWKVTLNRETQEVRIWVDPFRPKEGLKVPRGCTHIQLMASAGVVNLEKETMTSKLKTSAEWPVNMKDTLASEMVMNIPDADGGIVVVTFGVSFMKNTALRRERMTQWSGLRVVEVFDLGGGGGS